MRKEQEIMSGWEFALDRQTSVGADHKTECKELNDARIPAEEAFHKITLPHDWAIEMSFDEEMDQGAAQGFRNRWGIGWYRNRMALAEKKEGYRYILYFGGIYENSSIWVNGKYAGGRKYGYSSFKLDVSEFLVCGENNILVRVDNTTSPADRWYSGCGIYRTVKLIEKEETCLEEWDIVIHSDVCGRDVKLQIETGTSEMVKAVLKSCGKRDGKDIVAQSCSDSDGRIFLRLSDAELWSAETPNLYLLELMLLKDGQECDRIYWKIGFRDIRFLPGEGMTVNGVPTILKGVCLHQDVGCRGIAARKEVWRQRLKSLKEAGCNAIRAAHHIFAEEFLDLCDEMGFYVYEECFDKWHAGAYGRYFETEWKKDVETMVKRDRNRTCICIWGIGNEVENQAQQDMLVTLRELTGYVKSLDPSRPVTYAMNPHFKRESNVNLKQIGDIQKFVDEISDTEIYDNSERIERIARIAEYVDIISCNYQEQWYDMIHAAIPDKLILGTEIFQFFKGNENQMMNFTDEIPSLVPCQERYVIGGMIWTGIDYLGESMGWPSKGWSGSLIATNGVRKPGYYILQSYWSEKPMVHFSVMDYSLEDEGVKEHWAIPMLADHWHFPQFFKAVIPYIISTNCEEVQLYVNDKRIYLPEPARSQNHQIRGFVPWIPGNVTVIGLNGGKESCRHTLTTPGAPVKLSFMEELWELPMEAGYEKLFTVEAQDREGNLYFRESSYVRFRIEGPAEIVAVDNGRLMGNEPYKEQGIHLYHGKASVMVKLTGERGRVCLWADAEGMYSACIALCIME